MISLSLSLLFFYVKYDHVKLLSNLLLSIAYSLATHTLLPLIVT